KNPTALKGDYKGGFKLTTENNKFSLRLFSAIQFRYSFVQFDDMVKGNTEDYSNFYTRRARIWWDGHAYSPKFTYYFHLQLEPQGAVNLHDAWINYKFNDLFQIGLGRNKVPYSLEFLHSGFGLDGVDRTIFSGETDVDAGGGFSKWPGSNSGFPLSTTNANTGFPTGGMALFRSQGISINGLKGGKDKPTFEYQVGVWNGRDKRARSNEDDRHLYTARVGFHPLGQIDWLFCGDFAYTEKPKFSVWAAAYTESGLRTKDAAGASVTPYETEDTGYNLSAMFNFKNFSAEAEWSEESYDMDRNVAGVWDFDRGGWRFNLGYFIVPTRVQIVARHSEVERMQNPTAEKAKNSGLNLPQVWNGTKYVDALEKLLTETTAGVNFFFGAGHQHKLFFDVSLLTRQFEPYNGFAPDDQEDKRFRSMLQFKF
ncbi:MAG: porin, partial [Acidobacteriota bacterium]